MKKSVFTAAISLLMVIGSALGAAWACPDQSLYGEEYTFSSDDLWNERRLSVTAGGNIDLSGCYNVPGTGYVIENPDFTISYNRTQNYNLRFRTQAGCDTILLINDANNQWYWDDDSAGGTNAEVWVNNAAGGYIDVWIGTYGSSTCDAQLLIESFPS